MARIRSVKPDYYRHEGLQDLEAANPGAYAMLVFQGLWGHCDSQGVFEYRPRQLKLDILPFLPFDMEDTLALLVSAGFVKRYESGGRQYGIIESFPTHQRLSGKESGEAGVKHPLPSQEAPKKEKKATVKRERSDGEAPVKHPESQEEERSMGREGERNTGAREALADVPADLPEVVDDVGLVMQHVRAVLHPRMSREAQEKFILPRLKAGATVAQLCLVVDRFKAKWGNDDQMRQHLTPETLFRASKWEKHLIDAEDWDAAGRPPPVQRNGQHRSTTPAEKLAMIGGAH